MFLFAREHCKSVLLLELLHVMTVRTFSVSVMWSHVILQPLVVPCTINARSIMNITRHQKRLGGQKLRSRKLNLWHYKITTFLLFIVSCQLYCSKSQ